jgi:hypothetical protein
MWYKALPKSVLETNQCYPPLIHITRVVSTVDSNHKSVWDPHHWVTSGTSRTKNGTVATTTNYLSHLELWTRYQNPVTCGSSFHGPLKISPPKKNDHRYARKIKIIKIIHKSAHQPDLRLSHRASNFLDRPPPPLLNPQNSSAYHNWRRGCC